MDWIAFGLFLIWITLLCINGNLMRLTKAVRSQKDWPPLADPYPLSPQARRYRDGNR